ncbi:hypothetical protein AVEN_251914-1 [Araneus ventricosus]|uniref:Uncharacterized protein n=1 Tax=Araneus ventricosus TaxID=182803 RepID=A0A4Y2GYW5_ARAVE|nr:hypothetical protein AVEN_251914-1 [Araneus ventricosus]
MKGCIGRNSFYNKNVSKIYQLVLSDQYAALKGEFAPIQDTIQNFRPDGTAHHRKSPTRKAATGSWRFPASALALVPNRTYTLRVISRNVDPAKHFNFLRPFGFL